MKPQEALGAFDLSAGQSVHIAGTPPCTRPPTGHVVSTTVVGAGRDLFSTIHP